MRAVNTSTVILSISVLVLLAVAAAPGTAGNSIDPQPQNPVWGNGSNIVCLPEPEQTGGGYKLSCYTRDERLKGEASPARSDSEILRDMYRERYEPPFWKN